MHDAQKKLFCTSAAIAENIVRIWIKYIEHEFGWMDGYEWMCEWYVENDCTKQLIEWSDKNVALDDSSVVMHYHHSTSFQKLYCTSHDVVVN